MFPQRLLDPDYDQKINEKCERLLLYFGDELGFIKAWDLTYLLKCSGCGPLFQTHPELKGGAYLPHRIESIEVSSFIVASLHRAAVRKAKKLPEAVCPLFSRIQIRDCKAHKRCINSMAVDEEDGHIVSSSIDSTVRLWSPGLDLWGCLN